MIAEQPTHLTADDPTSDEAYDADMVVLVEEKPDPPPDEFIEKHNIAVDHSKNGRHRSALPLYEELAEVSYAPPEVNYNIAVTLRALGRHQEALAPLTKYIAVRPNDFQAWTNAGDSLRELGNHAAALQMFRYALKIAPLSLVATNAAAAHHNISRELLDLNEMDGALYHAEQACTLNPDDPEHVCGLGEIQLMLGRFDEGWANYEARHAKNAADAKSA